MSDTLVSNGTTNGAGETYTVPLLINGAEVHTDTTFDVTSPGTSENIWHASSVSKDDAIKAVEAAQAAFRSWSRAKPAFRRDIFLRAADILEGRKDELGQYMMDETGAEESFAKGFNAGLSTDMLREAAGKVSGIMGSIPVCAEEGTSALVYKEPFGVILSIAPWNAPYILGFRSVVYALAAGNTCVLKGSELSPRCFWAIGDVFKKAGLPDGCLNVIFHRPQDAVDVTTALIEHPFVKKVNFTGSTAVGSIIAATAGKNLKPTLMELGGKASAVVLDDADLETAAQQCVLGSFLHSGQICMATERIVVHSSIIDEFSSQLKAATEKLFGSDKPAPILVTPAGVQKVRNLLKDAVSRGAKVIAGDLDAKEDSETHMRPIIVENVTKDMDLYYTESFGPSVGLISVESEDEAVEIANDTEYGLSAAVFTKDLARGLRVARRIESGAVHINAMTVHDETNLPHGGVKKSGWGRFNAQWGIEEFLKTKTVTYRE